MYQNSQFWDFLFAKFEIFEKFEISEHKFWKLLKSIDCKDHSTRNIPYLNHNNTRVYNDEDKANIFAENLSNILKPYENENIFGEN